MVKAIVGGNWGDEGKGKITDMFAGDADVVIRYQGVPMPGTQSSTTMANLPCTCCRLACSIPTPLTS